MEQEKHTIMRIKNEKELHKILVSAGIDVDRWGQGSAKSLKDLWNEICEGVTTIQKNPVMRIVSVTEIKIKHGSDVLIEVEQEFKDRRRRQRNILPSEKIRRGESPFETAIRFISEEFSLDPHNAHIISIPVKGRQIISESPSFPSLITQYTIYTVEAEVEDLPDEDFWTEEKNSEQRGDPVRKHRWIWKSESETLHRK